MTQYEPWIQVCAAEDIDPEDVFRFDYGERTFALYRADHNHYFATDGYCTHQKFHLSEGLVVGKTIECPKHNGRFDYTTGKRSVLLLVSI
ncbi:Rieske 2Fe-2S domain-containing protein [Paenibacillus roseipurpureus]|uniref:Rieske 2Fe-2S domain-containing protein n=1 Tax=Paenibacillus roseopurpureus TaxID=2918901 RepID=A0AA96LQU4_9BACL|nr:Rieske 2Fe-2S domain-containing protein [Paenibacillus sp. MBLB1832]WNR44891.1 Rieske 2Fe-2S domain-containing protein [Paenibacillus sp. MBLB1832]